MTERLYRNGRSSGKGDTLLCPPPLRTVRASFPAYGSSFCGRPFHRTRFHLSKTSAVELFMAGRMEHHPVLRAIAAASRPPDDVMAVPPRDLGDLLVAVRAES